MSENIASPMDPKFTSRPIIHGNLSRYFKCGKRPGDNHTHQWTVYLRPYYQNDPILSTHFVKKVVFKLHDSYPQHLRSFTEGPPYEITETGWGEFDIVIRIYWKDSTERTPLTIYHPLKLFCADKPENQDIIKGLRPHVNEYYDEIIFNHPSQAIQKSVINNLPPIPPQIIPPKHFKPHSDYSNLPDPLPLESLSLTLPKPDLPKSSPMSQSQTSLALDRSRRKRISTVLKDGKEEKVITKTSDKDLCSLPMKNKKIEKPVPPKKLLEVGTETPREVIILDSMTPLTLPREDLACDYVQEEKKTLEKIAVRSESIQLSIQQLRDQIRIKQDMIYALQDSLEN